MKNFKNHQIQRMARCKKSLGFGLIESLVALVIIVFVFGSFMLIMMRSMTVAHHSNVQSDMGIELDNRVELSWMTGTVNISSGSGITYSVNSAGTLLSANQAQLGINQERIISVQ